MKNKQEFRHTNIVCLFINFTVVRLSASWNLLCFAAKYCLIARFCFEIQSSVPWCTSVNTCGWLVYPFTRTASFCIYLWKRQYSVKKIDDSWTAINFIFHGNNTDLCCITNSLFFQNDLICSKLHHLVSNASLALII